MKKTQFLSVLILSAIISTVLIFNQAIAGAKEKVRIEPGQIAHTFEGKVCKKLKMRYFLYLPMTYGKDKNKKWPVIVFLHGSGERGTKLSKVANCGLPRMLKKAKNFPAIVISPQCPANHWWNDIDVSLSVMAILKDVCKKYNVNPDRIYLTGLSMGGFGTWHLAQQYPNRWAALAPLCGSGNAWLQPRLKKIPTRVYHGAKDRNVPLAFGKLMYSALKDAGGQVKMTIFPDLAHNVWDKVYSMPEFWDWLFQQKRGQPDPTIKKKKTPVNDRLKNNSAGKAKTPARK